MRFRRRRPPAVAVGAGAVLTVDLPAGWAEMPVGEFTAAITAGQEPDLELWAARTALKALGPYTLDPTVDRLCLILGQAVDRILSEPAVWAAVWLPAPRTGISALAHATVLDLPDGIPIEELAADARADRSRERTVEVVRLPVGDALRVSGSGTAFTDEDREVVIESVDHIVLPDVAPVAVHLSVSWVSLEITGAATAAADELAGRVRVALDPG